MRDETTARAGSQSPIRILLADDHTVMRAGTRRILEDEPDLVVVGEASTGEEALRQAADELPDIVLLDIAMPDMDGIKACRELRAHWPEVRVLVLTGHDNDALLRTFHRLGAHGYLLKSAGPHELVSAIREVFRGGRVFTGSEAALADPHQLPDILRPTRKEIEVLTLVARGRKNREVAEELHLSVNTVEYHLRNLFAKLGASSRADALMRAQRLGWLDSSDLRCSNGPG